jgi:hypothetical protein
MLNIKILEIQKMDVVVLGKLQKSSFLTSKRPNVRTADKLVLVSVS